MKHFCPIEDGFILTSDVKRFYIEYSAQDEFEDKNTIWLYEVKVETANEVHKICHCKSIKEARLLINSLVRDLEG